MAEHKEVYEEIESFVKSMIKALWKLEFKWQLQPLELVWISRVDLGVDQIHGKPCYFVNKVCRGLDVHCWMFHHCRTSQLEKWLSIYANHLKTLYELTAGCTHMQHWWALMQPCKRASEYRLFSESKDAWRLHALFLVTQIISAQAWIHCVCCHSLPGKFGHYRTYSVSVSLVDVL